MANEANVVEQVAKAAKHPKAVLLGAIGAMCPTPSNSANMAEELGLNREEIQGTRWVALLKRGKTNREFLKRLLAILKEATVVQTTVGGRHNLELLKSGLQQIFKEGEIREFRWTSGGKTPSENVSHLFIDEKNKRLCRIDSEESTICNLEAWFAKKISIHLFDKQPLKKLMRFAERFQKKTGIEVVIHQQY